MSAEKVKFEQEDLNEARWTAFNLFWDFLLTQRILDIRDFREHVFKPLRDSENSYKSAIEFMTQQGSTKAVEKMKRELAARLSLVQPMDERLDQIDRYLVANPEPLTSRLFRR